MRTFLRIFGSLCLVAALSLAAYAAFFFKITVHDSDAAQSPSPIPGFQPGEITNMGLMANQIGMLLFCVVLAVFGTACVVVGQRWGEEEAR